MKRIKVDNAQETLILTGMIVSDRFMRDVQSVFDRRLLKSNYSRKIAKWCVDYFEENEKAPKAHIQDIFNEKVESGKLEEADSQMIARILERVSDNYESTADTFNDEYVLKVAEKYFSTADMKKMCSEVLEIADRDPVEARELLLNFEPKLIPHSEGYDVLRDSELTRRAFTSSREPLFLMPGALGDMVNSDLCRGSFMGIMGAEKIGKSFQLMEFGFQAIRQRCNVAIFQAGDMNDEQQARRIGIRTSGKPDKDKYSRNNLIPVYDCLKNQINECTLKYRKNKRGLGIETYADLVTEMGTDKGTKLSAFKFNDSKGYKPCQECRRRRPYDYMPSVWYRYQNVAPLTWREADIANRKFAKRIGRKKMMLRSYPSDTLSVRKVISQLELWEKQLGFIPDLIITDYSDLFVSDDSRLEFRHASNSIWKGHRSLSQSRSALVMTVTQTDANAYGKDTLNLSNFSEDKRKYAHVTSFYTLNQTPEEKMMGLMRYGSLLARDDEFHSNQHVTVLQSPAIARAHLGSFIIKSENGKSERT